MKVVIFLETCGKILELMSKHDIRVSDYKYVDLYMDYVRMREKGIKYIAVIMELSEKYDISESTVKRIVKRFSKDI